MSHTPVPRAVPALDLKAQYATIRDELNAAILQVLESQHFVLGPEVAAFEREFAALCAAPHASACASGSDALLLPLMAWQIGPGDEVITTPYSFFATASAIWRVGAKPIFVDILPETFNIDPAQVAAAITPRTRVIIPVHLYGQAAEMNAVRALAAPRGIKVLEDAAQAVGATDIGGPVGSLGDAAAFSFYPSKNLGGCGDGGLMTTPDADLVKCLNRLRAHGMEPRYYHHEVGINSRLDALQAAALRVKLRHLENWTRARRAVAANYRSLFSEMSLDGLVVCPTESPSRLHVYNQFVIRVPGAQRDALRTRLTERGIGTEIYYPVPLHLQRCFESLGYREGDFPQAERAAKETIALPMYPELSADSQRYVVASIAEFFAGAHAPAGIPKPHVPQSRVSVRS